MLDTSGRLRWDRLEDLIKEGSKSLDYDPHQLWLLAQWVLGPQGVSVRKPLIDELVRLIDTVVAGPLLTHVGLVSRPDLLLSCAPPFEKRLLVCASPL